MGQLEVLDGNIEELLESFGQTVKYYASRVCSCIKENNGQPILNHICNMGYYYADPETITAIRTAVNQKYINGPFGKILNGGATFTIPKNVNNVEQTAWKKIANGDVLVLDNKTKRDTDILTKGTRDKLYAFDVTEILSIYRYDTEYLEGIDFTTSETTSAAGSLTTINWEIGHGPEDGETYTCEFICKQQFKVWDDGGQDRGTDNDELPKKVICQLRRFNLFEENNIDSVETNQDIY